MTARSSLARTSLISKPMPSTIVRASRTKCETASRPVLRPIQGSAPGSPGTFQSRSGVHNDAISSGAARERSRSRNCWARRKFSCEPIVFLLLMPHPHSVERGVERSDLRESTIDEQLGARYKTGVVGCQERDRLGDLVGSANPAKRSRPGDVLGIRVNLL